MRLMTTTSFLSAFVLPFPAHRVVELWREDLAKTNAKAAQSLADPTEYENLFPELKQALQAEEFLKRESMTLLPAASFASVPVSLSASLTHTHIHTHTLSLSLPSSLSLFPLTPPIYLIDPPSRIPLNATS